MATENSIGRFHWRVCEKCIHKLEEVRNGSTCAVDKDDWELELEYDNDEILCGCFQEESLLPQLRNEV